MVGPHRPCTVLTSPPSLTQGVGHFLPPLSEDLTALLLQLHARLSHSAHPLQQPLLTSPLSSLRPQCQGPLCKERGWEDCQPPQHIECLWLHSAKRPVNLTTRRKYIRGLYMMSLVPCFPLALVPSPWPRALSISDLSKSCAAVLSVCLPPWNGLTAADLINTRVDITEFALSDS